MKRLADWLLPLILAPLLALATAVMPASAQGDPTVSANLREAGRLAAAGRTLDAGELLQRTIQAAPPAERRNVYQAATWICLQVRDADCMGHLLEGVLPLLQALPSSDLTAHDLVGVFFYQIATGAWLRPDQRLADQKLAQLAPAMQDPATYAELQLLAAWQSRAASDFAAAQDHLDQALIGTLSLPRDVGPLAPYLLVTIIKELLVNADIERALRLTTAAEPILRQLPPGSLLSFELLQIKSTLLTYANDFTDAAKDLERALALLDVLQVHAPFKASEKARLSSYQIGLDVLRGDGGSALMRLQAHPLMAAKPAILQRGFFADGNEGDFALTEEFTRAVANDQSETGWGDLLTASPNWTTDPSLVRRVQIFGQAAAGLQFLRHGKTDEARRAFQEAARKRLDMLQEQYRRSPLGSPLPDYIDRALLEFATASTLLSKAPDYDLLTRAHTVLNRSLQTSPDDALTLQAAQTSDDRKRLAQALFTTRQQQAAWEVAEVAALGRRLAAPEARDEQAIARDRQRILTIGYNLTSQKQRLRASLLDGTKGDAGEGTAVIADLKTVQQLLGEDEALIFHVPATGHVGKVCIRRDRAYSALEPIPATIDADVKLLTAALTATHPPSVEADSQFPASAAVRLAKLLFGGLDDCLKASHRVYLLPLQGQAGRVPPAALLAEMPPTLGQGFDLRAAHWLIRDHSFVRTTSINAFVATRKLAQSRRATLDYLGIADPALAPPDATAGKLQAARGTTAGELQALSNLPNLPETSEEVQQAAGLFDRSRTRLLLGKAASEQAFRLEPLSEFDVIHFATHGLVKEEVPGLKEASLVLTPNPRGDGLDDGLLTGSQIAALPLRARLVVLSACNSARYEPSVIDSGIQGLSTSFAIAGVPSTVASLWPIDSLLARDLVGEMLRANRDVGIADALALAVRKHLDGPAPRPLLHPRFWAALIVLGDGSTRIGSTAGMAPRDLGTFAIPDERPGLILSAAAVEGGVVTSDIHRGEPGTPAWSISHRKIDGTPTWTIGDQATGGAPVVTAGPLIVTAAATDRPKLQAFHADGQAAWTHSFVDAPAGTKVLQLASVPDRSILALIGPASGPNSDTGFSLARLNANGETAAAKTLECPGSTSPVGSAVLATTAKTVLVVANRTARLKTGADSNSINSLGALMPCWEGDTADIVLVDPTSLAQKTQSGIPHFQAASATLLGDDWILVGHVADSCGRGANAAVFRIKSDGSVQPLWRDSSPFLTWASAVRIVGDSIEIIGHNKRSMGVAEQLDTPTSSDPSTPRSGDEEFNSGEAISVRLSRDGIEQRRDFVGAGLPLVTLGMTAADGHTVIFGSVGLRELWMVRD